MTFETFGLNEAYKRVQKVGDRLSVKKALAVGFITHAYTIASIRLMSRKRQLKYGITEMPPIEVHRNVEKTFIKRTQQKGIPVHEKEEGSHAQKLSGILKIKDPRIIEEIAESNLLA